ncbi:hypothetical protein BJF78_01550 [Pseudonocardia sp. CNS-139]|nr:hypothetical protein BJF78_01550 [Pseudonocardia sp. CNS-139]
MADHWDRPGWRDGRRTYHWMLTFPDHEQLRWLAHHCAGSVRHLAFDPVPLDGLHLTLRRIGYVDEVDAALLDDVLGRARERTAGLAPFPVTVGPLTGSPGAVMFSVTPWTELFGLHDALCAAAGEVTGTDYPAAAQALRPHVSVAYSRARQPARAVRAAISHERWVRPVEAQVSAAELVELRREGAAYRWTTVGRVELTAG